MGYNTQTPMKLIEGVPIYTFWEPCPVAEAMVVQAGRIVAVGPREELRARYRGVKRVRLDGGAIVPAFNDCHCHVLALGIDLGKADLRGCTSIPEIQHRLREWAAQHPDAAWILGRAYDQNLLQEGRHLTRHDLDAVSRERPVFLNHVSKHGAAANSRALAIASITRETPDPPDGTIGRDERGEPTGILLESAATLVSRHIPKPTGVELVEAVHRATQDMARRGILAASDASTGWLDLQEEVSAYARALEQGAPVRLTLMPLYNAAARAGWLAHSESAGEATGFSPEPSAPHPDLRWGAIKLFADGAFTTRTAALREPYADTGTTGTLMHEPEELMERILAVHRAGWQCAVHAIGDRAIELVLQGYQRALAAFPRDDHRHRIEHAMLMADDLLDRMQSLGVVAVPQPEFLWWLTTAYRKGLGERARALMPYRSWLQRGIAVAFSSDQPVVPGDPIIGWRAAVTRTSMDGTCLLPEEGLEPLTALRLFTLGGAYATRDPELGILAPGAQARWVLLSHPPETVAVADMRVLTTSAHLGD
ncbi:N-substituted formamide deformylase [bacterium HR15]|nr:N-substituted formamide deformylase [bacterium HR15]